MSECNGIPTLQTIKDAGTNAEVFNQVVTSNAMKTTKVDTAGNKHKTLFSIDNMSEQASAARDVTLTYRNETFTARDTTLGYRNETRTARDTTLGYRDETRTAKDVTLGYRNETFTARDNTFTARDTALGYRDEAFTARNVTLANAQQVADDRELVENVVEGVVNLTSTVMTNVSITKNLLKLHPIY